MKIYVSGSYAEKQRLREESGSLILMGHEVTSSWLQEATKPDQLTEKQWEVRLAKKDVAEVFASDCIILDLTNNSTTGGRYVEWGVAVHPLSKLLCYTVGPCNGVFNRLADEQFSDWDQLRQALQDPTAVVREYVVRDYSAPIYWEGNR